MIKRSTTFFIAVIFSMFFLPAIVSAQMPDKTADQTAWEAYAKKILMKESPKDEKLINGLSISIIPTKKRGDFYMPIVNLLGWQVIIIERSVIEDIDNEGEFAFILEHELAHIGAKDEGFPMITDSLGTHLDFGKFFNQENLADQTAQDKTTKMDYSPCSGYIIVNKLFGAGARANPSNPYNQGVLKRLELLLAPCKESMPHIPGKADPSPR